MHTTDIGNKAEAATINYLDHLGYTIIDKNWKTKTCEIDIIACRNFAIYFVEVKYRTRSNQGSGFDYIIPSKLRRMDYAARLWVARQNWRGEYVIAAAEVSGKSYVVRFIEQVDI